MCKIKKKKSNISSNEIKFENLTKFVKTYRCSFYKLSLFKSN